jgi:hypothetical protein
MHQIACPPLQWHVGTSCKASSGRQPVCMMTCCIYHRTTPASGAGHRRSLGYLVSRPSSMMLSRPSSMILNLASPPSVQAPTFSAGTHLQCRHPPSVQAPTCKVGLHRGLLSQAVPGHHATAQAVAYGALRGPHLHCVLVDVAGAKLGVAVQQRGVLGQTCGAARAWCMHGGGRGGGHKHRRVASTRGYSKDVGR